MTVDRLAAAQAKRARKAAAWVKACAATEEGRRLGAVTWYAPSRRPWLSAAWRRKGISQPLRLGLWDLVATINGGNFDWRTVMATRRLRALNRPRSRAPIGRCWGHSRSQMLRRLRAITKRLAKLNRAEMRAVLFPRRVADGLRGVS